MRIAKKCTCGLSKKVYCKNCSKVRMVICLKNGQDHLKQKNPRGEYNPVWYSFLKYNTKDVYDIIKKMEEKVRLHPDYANAANVLLFYVNGQRTHHIHKVTL